jgi:prolipoprotein diacylglyceryl transferase
VTPSLSSVTYLAAIPSPAQGVWHLGPVPVRAYALFIIIGIIAALVIGDRRWEARGGERGVIYDIALWAVPFGLIGGRLYHVVTDWWRYFGEDGAGISGVLRIWEGGLGIWGAVALGAVGAWMACRRRKIPLPAFGDAIAPGIVLAQAIGRIGNYFNQELYGGPTTLPWALEIYERRNAAGVIDNLNGVSTGQVVATVHPTFLYELLWNLLVFVVLIWVDRRFKFGHGRLFALYVAGYCVGRFWIELLRTDDATLIEGVRINSFTATFVFIGAVVYIMVAPKGREDPATLKAEDWPEDLTEELTAVSATSGVVAAVKAAAADDETTQKLPAEALVADPPTGDVDEADDTDEELAGILAEVAEQPAAAAVDDEDDEDDEDGLLDVLAEATEHIHYVFPRPEPAADPEPVADADADEEDPGEPEVETFEHARRLAELTDDDGLIDVLAEAAEHLAAEMGLNLYGRPEAEETAEPEPEPEPEPAPEPEPEPEQGGRMRRWLRSRRNR